MNRCSTTLAIIVMILCFLFSIGCGSSSTSNTLSAAQAQAVSQELTSAVSSALTATISSGLPAPGYERPSIASALKQLRDAQASGCTASSTGQTCDIAVNYTGSCAGGGSISVSGDFNFTLDNTGDGSDSSSLTIIPTNCSVSNLVINGAPSITVATEFNIKADAMSYPFSLTETGGISYGPNPSGRCSVDATMNVSSPTSCSISGSICGRKLTGTC